jgi:predicted nucleic acid binding AN1-type Zn finger protein
MHALCNMLEALGKDLASRFEDLDSHVNAKLVEISLAQENHLQQVQSWKQELHEEKVKTCDQLSFLAKSQAGGSRGSSHHDELPGLFLNLEKAVGDDFLKFEKSLDDALSRHAAQSAGMLTKWSGPLLDTVERALAAAKPGVVVEAAKCGAPIVESCPPWKQQNFGPLSRPGGDEERKLDIKNLKPVRDDDDVYSEHSVHTLNSKVRTPSKSAENERVQESLSKKIQEVHSKLDEVKTHEITVERRIEEMHAKLAQEISMLRLNLQSEFSGEFSKKRCTVKGCTAVLSRSDAFHCTKCGQDVCMQHRLEKDHACGSLSTAAKAGGDSRQPIVEASAEAEKPRSGGFFRCLTSSKSKPRGEA